MPNWVENKVTFIEGCDRLLQKLHELDNHIAENRPCLFNSFVPRPAIYDKYDTTNYEADKLKVGDECHLYYELGGSNTVVTVTPEILADFKAAVKEQKEKYGAVGWYDWNCKYWGTKWDVSDWAIFHDSLILATAWSHPMEFFIALSKQYPEAVFAVEYADEDLGSNCGCFFYKDGKFLSFDAAFMYAANVSSMNLSDIYYNYVDEEDWEEAE